MVPTFTLLVWIFSLSSFSACGLGTPGEAEGTGYLYQPSFEVEGELREPRRPYHAQPGDIFLSTDRLRIAVSGPKLAGGKGMHHSGLISLRPTGSPASLEAGPHHAPPPRVRDMT